MSVCPGENNLRRGGKWIVEVLQVDRAPPWCKWFESLHMHNISETSCSPMLDDAIELRRYHLSDLEELGSVCGKEFRVHPSFHERFRVDLMEVD